MTTEEEVNRVTMSDAKRRAKNKWNRENMAEKYDRINILAPKGRKEEIAAAAKRANESISQYILTATAARMEAKKEE